MFKISKSIKTEYKLVFSWGGKDRKVTADRFGVSFQYDDKML